MHILAIELTGFTLILIYGVPLIICQVFNLPKFPSSALPSELLYVLSITVLWIFLALLLKISCFRWSFMAFPWVRIEISVLRPLLVSPVVENYQQTNLRSQCQRRSVLLTPQILLYPTSYSHFHFKTELGDLLNSLKTNTTSWQIFIWIKIGFGLISHTRYNFLWFFFLAIVFYSLTLRNPLFFLKIICDPSISLRRVRCSCAVYTWNRYIRKLYILLVEPSVCTPNVHWNRPEFCILSRKRCNWLYPCYW